MLRSQMLQTLLQRNTYLSYSIGIGRIYCVWFSTSAGFLCPVFKYNSKYLFRVSVCLLNGDSSNSMFHVEPFLVTHSSNVYIISHVILVTPNMYALFVHYLLLTRPISLWYSFIHYTG